MFKLSEKHVVDRRILKCDFIRYSPSKSSTVYTPDSQIYNNSPRGDSVNSLKGSLLRLSFDVLHAAFKNGYSNGNDIILVKFGPIALFRNSKLTTSSGKHEEEVCNTHIVTLIYKLILSCNQSDDLYVGFDRDRTRRKKLLTDNKNIKCKCHVTLMLSHIFGFAEHQEKGTYGLGYKTNINKK